MPKRLRYSPRVPIDLARAIAWYERLSPSLGERFKKAVRSSISRIEKNPAAFAISFESYRSAPVKQFPYVIVYDFDAAAIGIYAVVHSSSDLKRQLS